MNKQTVKSITAILGTLGVLFFISTAFSILPSNVATFSGIACFIIAGLVRQLARSSD